MQKDLEAKLELIKVQQEANHQIEKEKANCVELRQNIPISAKSEFQKAPCQFAEHLEVFAAFDL